MGFSSHWLGLREAADHAARNTGLLVRAAHLVPPGSAILDLGSGTGSTARAFAAQGFDGLHWRFLDNDADLLEVAGTLHPKAETVVGNLGDVDALPLDGVGLVTASALLDLMPADWVTALAIRLDDGKIPFYAALSYDGDMRWTPAHPEDVAITTHFNRHQQTDKGIGAALGPLSGAQASTIFTDQGFDVTVASSPWMLGPDTAALHLELLDGIGAAAAEAGHPNAARWTAGRRASAQQSQAVIGHTDILALPTPP